MSEYRLSFSRLVLKTHEVYWEHFLTFVGLLAIPHLPVAFPSLVPGLLRNSGSVVGAFLVVAWGLLYLMAWTALIWAIGAALRREDLGIVSAFSHVRLAGPGRLIWSYCFAACLFVLMILTGAILIGLVGAFARSVGALLTALFTLTVVGAAVWWLLRLLFLPQVVVLEGRSGLSAISRCRELVKGRSLRVFVILFLFTLLEGVVTWALGSVPVLRYLAGLLVAPVGAIWVTLLYYERVDATLLSPARSLPRGATPRLS